MSSKKNPSLNPKQSSLKAAFEKQESLNAMDSTKSDIGTPATARSPVNRSHPGKKNHHKGPQGSNRSVTSTSSSTTKGSRPKEAITPTKSSNGGPKPRNRPKSKANHQKKNSTKTPNREDRKRASTSSSANNSPSTQHPAKLSHKKNDSSSMDTDPASQETPQSLSGSSNAFNMDPPSMSQQRTSASWKDHINQMTPGPPAPGAHVSRAPASMGPQASAGSNPSDAPTPNEPSDGSSIPLGHTPAPTLKAAPAASAKVTPGSDLSAAKRTSHTESSPTPTTHDKSSGRTHKDDQTQKPLDAQSLLQQFEQATSPSQPKTTPAQPQGNTPSVLFASSVKGGAGKPQGNTNAPASLSGTSIPDDQDSSTGFVVNQPKPTSILKSSSIGGATGTPKGTTKQSDHPFRFPNPHAISNKFHAVVPDLKNLLTLKPFTRSELTRDEKSPRVHHILDSIQRSAYAQSTFENQDPHTWDHGLLEAWVEEIFKNGHDYRYHFKATNDDASKKMHQRAQRLCLHLAATPKDRCPSWNKVTDTLENPNYVEIVLYYSQKFFGPAYKSYYQATEQSTATPPPESSKLPSKAPTKITFPRKDSAATTTNTAIPPSGATAAPTQPPLGPNRKPPFEEPKHSTFCDLRTPTHAEIPSGRPGFTQRDSIMKEWIPTLLDQLYQCDPKAKLYLYPSEDNKPDYHWLHKHSPKSFLPKGKVRGGRYLFQVWFKPTGEPSNAKVLIRHDVPREKLLMDFAFVEDFSKCCEESDVGKFYFTESVLQEPDTIPCGWLYGSSRFTNLTNLGEAMTKTTELSSNQISVELRWKHIQSEPRQFVPFDDRVNAVHVYCARRHYNQLLGLLNKIYHHKRKVGFPQHKRFYFVPDFGTTQCKMSREGADWATHEAYKAEQAGHLRTLQFITLRKIVRNASQAVADFSPVDLYAGIAGLYDLRYPDHPCFLGLDQDKEDSKAWHLSVRDMFYHIGLEVSQKLGLIFYHRFGSHVWNTWFTEDYGRDQLSQFTYDATTQKYTAKVQKIMSGLRDTVLFRASFEYSTADEPKEECLITNLSLRLPSVFRNKAIAKGIGDDAASASTVADKPKILETVYTTEEAVFDEDILDEEDQLLTSPMEAEYQDTQAQSQSNQADAPINVMPPPVNHIAISRAALAQALRQSSTAAPDPSSLVDLSGDHSTVSQQSPIEDELSDTMDLDQASQPSHHDRPKTSSQDHPDAHHMDLDPEHSQASHGSSLATTEDDKAPDYSLSPPLLTAEHLVTTLENNPPSQTRQDEYVGDPQLVKHYIETWYNHRSLKNDPTIASYECQQSFLSNIIFYFDIDPQAYFLARMTKTYTDLLYELSDICAPQGLDENTDHLFIPFVQGPEYYEDNLLAKTAHHWYWQDLIPAERATLLAYFYFEARVTDMAPLALLESFQKDGTWENVVSKQWQLMARQQQFLDRSKSSGPYLPDTIRTLAPRAEGEPD